MIDKYVGTPWHLHFHIVIHLILITLFILFIISVID